MKRKCDGCKALFDYYDHIECALKYEFDEEKKRPKEPCPKPRTWKELYKTKSKTNR